MPRKELYIHGKGAVPVVKALSNEVRLGILDFIGDDEVSVQTITERTGLSKTAILTHLKLLEEAGFIQTRYVPGTVRNQKVCRKMYDRLIFDFASVPPERIGITAKRSSSRGITLISSFTRPAAWPARSTSSIPVV